MKKRILMLVLVSMVFMGVVQASGINGDYKGNPIVNVKSDGKILEADEVPAMIYDGHTLVPIAMLRQLGASVTWDQDTYSVDVKIPKPSLSTTPDVDSFIKKYGLTGKNIIFSAQYFTIGEGTGQLQFSLNYNSTDSSKQEEYNDLMNDVVNTSAYQVKMNYLDGYSVFIFTQDTRDYWSGKITKDEYVKKLKIVNNNAPQTTVTPPATTSDSAIESSIDGEFDGWDGETIFKLSNGQIWQQDSYAYTYHYAYMPKVIIFQDGSRYKMQVSGVDDTIYVKRLK